MSYRFSDMPDGWGWIVSSDDYFVIKTTPEEVLFYSTNLKKTRMQYHVTHSELPEPDEYRHFYVPLELV